MKKNTCITLFTTFLLTGISLVKAQKSIDTLDGKLPSIDSNRICYGYYVTNEGQKVPATFIIAGNDGLTDTRWVEDLQYCIKVLQKDSSVNILRPGKIKGYKIENWGRINLHATPVTRGWNLPTSNNITLQPAEFESVIFNAAYEHVTGYSEMTNQHYDTHPYYGIYFFNIKQKGIYINQYYWWETESPGRGHALHPYVSEALFNKRNNILIGRFFNGNQDEFCPDDLLLASLIKKRYLSAESDLEIIYQEYTYWRWKQDCLNTPDSVNSPVFSHYLNKQTDTSYGLKAVIDANKMYRHRGILLTSALITTTLTPFALFPYWRYEIKKSPKYPACFYSNSSFSTNNDYITTYKEVSIDTKGKMLNFGGTLGLFGFLTVLFIVTHKN